MKDKIIAMLSQGYSQTIVASAVGCTDGYISQILEEEGIRDQVALARVGQLEEAVEHDKIIEDIEDKALAKMQQLIQYCTKPMEVVRIFEAANKAVKRADTGQAQRGVAAGTTVVQLNISGAAAVQLGISQQAVQMKVSSDKQVVEVDGRSMATLPVRELTKQVAARAASRPQLTDSMTAEAVIKGIEGLDRVLEITGVESVAGLI